MDAFDNVDDPRETNCGCSINDYPDQILKEELVRRQEQRLKKVKQTLEVVSTVELIQELERRGDKL